VLWVCVLCVLCVCVCVCVAGAAGENGKRVWEDIQRMGTEERVEVWLGKTWRG